MKVTSHIFFCKESIFSPRPITLKVVTGERILLFSKFAKEIQPFENEVGWVSPVRFSISEQKLFFENYRKVITFQSPSPDILLRLNNDNSRKVVSSRFPEKSRFPISWKKSPVYYQSFCPTGWLSGTRWGFCRNRI